MINSIGRTLFLFLMLTANIVASGNPPKTGKLFTLKGDVQLTAQPDCIYLYYQKEDARQVLDSAAIKGGKFIFNGILAHAVRAVMSYKDPGKVNKQGDSFVYRSLYIEPGVMTMSGRGSLDDMKIAGSTNQLAFEEWEKINGPLERQMNGIWERLYYNRGNPDSVTMLNAASLELNGKQETALTAFIRRHPDSWVGWEQLFIREIAMDPETFAPSFDALAPAFKNSEEGRKMASLIGINLTTRVGMPAPDFTQNDPQGHAVHLSDYRRKYVLVDFWANICRAENPNVLCAYNAYKDKGFTVLGVSLDDSTERQKWLDAIREDNMPWQQVSDLKGWKNSAAVQYGIIGIPQNVLIDPGGKIIGKNLRDQDLMNKLLEIFEKGQNVRVDGNISGIDDTLAIFLNPNAIKIELDSVAVKDGKFRWVSDISEPEQIFITFLPSRRMVRFYADIGYLEISGNETSLNTIHHLLSRPSSVKVKGSLLQEEADIFYNSIQDITTAQDSLDDQYKKLTADQQQTVDDKLDVLDSIKKDRIEEYIYHHSKSLLSLHLIEELSQEDYQRVYPLYRSLSDHIRNTPSGRRIEGLLVGMKAKSRGEPVMSFSLPDTTGKLVSVARMKGQYVLIDFWASWCAPCRAENPHIIQAYRKYAGKKFTVIGISVDSDTDQWKKAILEDGMSWTQLLDVKQEVSKRYQLQYMPWNFLLDPQGKIIAINLHGKELSIKLHEMLN